ncbi:sigma-70 family RNA polymerase sigma factor [Lentisphaera profundi]|uniref:Sigma-70 family RNA polymerase sigma factor n=1 Tax=Lentisphaera profundi TaxID=1658616 RepID=A0ABY7W0S9_9BACT|nr:sigma-70 family RNA polymerase sigma factor [Lentisphaera profundi]WDE98636.1 sigma-70 family RNA polymerase sigma factor [Lentisphaera profundi]
MQSDKQVIKKYLNGDDSAFDELYGRYRLPLYAYLSRLAPGQSQLVDDLFQKTWMKVVAYLPRYEDRQTFLAWSMRISHNLLIDHFRKENRRYMDELPEDVSCSDHVPGESLVFGELSDALKRAISKLPNEQRQVLDLRQENIPFKEIAVIQGVSLNTALGRMHYAVKRLRDLLKSWDQPHG